MVEMCIRTRFPVALRLISVVNIISVRLEISSLFCLQLMIGGIPHRLGDALHPDVCRSSRSNKHFSVYSMVQNQLYNTQYFLHIYPQGFAVPC